MYRLTSIPPAWVNFLLLLKVIKVATFKRNKVSVQMLEKSEIANQKSYHISNYVSKISCVLSFGIERVFCVFTNVFCAAGIPKYVCLELPQGFKYRLNGGIVN